MHHTIVTGFTSFHSMIYSILDQTSLCASFLLSSRCHLMISIEVTLCYISPESPSDRPVVLAYLPFFMYLEERSISVILGHNVEVLSFTKEPSQLESGLFCIFQLFF